MEAIAEAIPLAFRLWVFCTGAVVGSFLNVVIARVPAGESVVSPPSRCPRCKAGIAWYDNVPILSWIALRAKCRRCGLPIASRYPTVEGLTGVVAVAIAVQLGPTWAALGYFAFAAALVALAFIDLDTWLLPHQITWPLFAVGLLSPLWNRDLTWAESLIGAAAGFSLFAAIALFGEKVLKKETMGWGDVFLLGAIGAWLGWPSLLPVVLLSALQGSVVGLLLIAAKKVPVGEAPQEEGPTPPAAPEPAPAATPEPAAAPGATAETSSLDDDWTPPKHAVPFGPFLALAALEQLLVGARLAEVWFGFVSRLLP